eukprot:1726674-Rhodomonas_salina.1
MAALPASSIPSALPSPGGSPRQSRSVIRARLCICGPEVQCQSRPWRSRSRACYVSHPVFPRFGFLNLLLAWDSGRTSVSAENSTACEQQSRSPCPVC